MQMYINRLEKELAAERSRRRTTLDTRILAQPTEQTPQKHSTRKQLNCTFKENNNHHNFRY